jgi:osmotically inducible protein OsmC
MSLRVTRSARATWRGTVTDGGGRIALGSGAYEGPLTLRARVEDVGRATNPEELIGAAEAGCFTMSLADLLSEAGHPPTELETTAKVTLEQLEGGFRLTRIELATHGQIPGIEEHQFLELAEQAKATCPISRALAGTEISLQATLEAGR